MAERREGQIRIGANPIIWSNDDFRELGGDIPLERCLEEMRAAGYAGTELGHKFPRRPEVLAPLLRRHGLQLVSGWHSLHLLEGDLEEETRAFLAHLDLLARCGSSLAIVAECSGRTYHDPGQLLRFDRGGGLGAADWDRLGRRLELLAQKAAERGLRLAYHHHMGTVIQGEGEIDELLQRTRRVGLLADTGHLVCAGIDPLSILRRHAGRIVHVHLKDVRPGVLAQARAGRFSFAAAVKAGIFTVPGDGAIAFPGVFECLLKAGYGGWMVVEAEQDPAQAPPFAYAQMGRDHVRTFAGL